MGSPDRRSRRLGGVTILSFLVAAVVAMLVVAATLGAIVADASTVWTARFSYGVATIRVGAPDRLAVTASHLRVATRYPITLRKGTCTTLGALVASTTALATATGTLSRTLYLTSLQTKAARLPLAIRVGSRCGRFALPVVATPTPTPTPVPTPAGTPLPVGLDTWCNASVDSCASAYVNWSGSVTRLEQAVDIAQLGRTTFAALAWNGGYTGVQNGGNAVSGAVGPTALFSLGGQGVTIRPLPNGMPNPNCEGGFDTGAGASCRIHLTQPIQNGDRYVYRVTPETDGWLRGEIVLPGGSVLWIADLKPGPAAPASFTGLYNFIEYFGARVMNPADAPTSTVTFTQPGAGIEFSRASRIGGVCANAYRQDVPFGISLVTFGIGGCG